MKRIAIVGLGQIGGSLVLSLRKTHSKLRITGVDPSSKCRRLMKKYLDESSAAWSEIL